MICASTELKATFERQGELLCVPCRAGTATCARGGCGREMADQLVTAQLLGVATPPCARRYSGAAQCEQARRHHAARHQVRLAHRPDTHHQVDLLGDEIDDPVVELHLQLQVGVACREFRQCREQQRAARTPPARPRAGAPAPTDASP